METIGAALRPGDRVLVDDLLELRALAGERLAMFHENPRAVGSRKQPVAYPALGEYLVLMARIHALSAELLLSPRARYRACVAAE